MSDPDDTLEDELRALLTRVLSVQMDDSKKRLEALSATVSALTRTNNEELRNINKRFEQLHEQGDDHADSLKSTLTEVNEALALQMAGLHSALEGTRTALSSQYQEGRQELAEVSAGSMTKIIDAVEVALNVLQKLADERSGALNQATVQLTQSFDDKSALTQSRISALERKIGLLTSLSITAVIFLVMAVAGAGAIYLGVAPGRFPS